MNNRASEINNFLAQLKTPRSIDLVIFFLTCFRYISRCVILQSVFQSIFHSQFEILSFADLRSAAIFGTSSDKSSQFYIRRIITAGRCNIG